LILTPRPYKATFATFRQLVANYANSAPRPGSLRPSGAHSDLAGLVASLASSARSEGTSMRSNSVRGTRTRAADTNTTQFASVDVSCEPSADST
jgi:hypothetical protein